MKRLLLALVAAAALWGSVSEGLAQSRLPPTVQVQTIGDKERSAQSAAAQSNPAINPPLTIAPAWVIATPYVAGNVRAANSNIYVQVNSSCTSAASGTGPAGTNSNLITDNTCSWYYFGQPASATSDSAAPTVTTSTAGSPFASAVLFTPATYPSLYKVYGATPATLATFYWNFTTFNNKAGNAIGYGYKVCANVTDAKFAVGYTNSSPAAAVIIDGRYYSPEVQFQTGGTPNWWIFDFTATTGYKQRNVCLQSGKAAGASFAGFATTPAGVVAAPVVSNEIKAAFVYDSYDAGSGNGPFTSYGTLGATISNMLGWTYWPMGQGSTGVQNQGTTCSTTCYNYLQRVQDAANAAILAQQNIILFNVSTNDGGLSGEQAAVTALLTAIRAANSTALIIGIGPAPLNSAPTYAQTQALDTAGAAAFAAYSDPAGAGLTCYIPFANAVVPAITGSFETGNPTNANSFGTLISNGDGVHPTDTGTQVIAKWLTVKIATSCLAAVR